ncbi:probable E3 ubiquitin-protein ligase IRF2BPL [Oryx dammah]|uniref:probable E3 ubiquitin-protein ligase IRF2BPL n=1 Tax=Oryx dammah TaxID=59534 RepID=UPI001A9B5E54|nr:probable E3 ubiquitin-protein ligase IRF2BPL [Oryx dammah]
MAIYFIKPDQMVSRESWLARPSLVLISSPTTFGGWGYPGPAPFLPPPPRPPRGPRGARPCPAPACATAPLRNRAAVTERLGAGRAPARGGQERVSRAPETSRRSGGPDALGWETSAGARPELCVRPAKASPQERSRMVMKHLLQHMSITTPLSSWLNLS